ncbi:MAG: ABC transporter permease [Thermoplasmata archaeon]
MPSFRRVLAKRVINALITVMLIMALNYILFRVMPGDPAKLLTPRDPTTTNATFERNIREFGLDKPPVEQFFYYFYATFKGDWGTSYVYKEPVTEVISGAVAWTCLMVGISTIFTFVIGIVLGKIAARRRGKSADVAITGFGLFFYGMPIFWFGIVLMVMFVGVLNWFPTGGYITEGTHPFPLTFSKLVDILWHLTLPAATLAIGSVAGIVLIQRNSLIDVLTEEYIVTAYAKGLTEQEVMRYHATPNARLPVVTTIAMDTAFILGGAFQVEVVFSYRGIGFTTVESIYKQDYPVLQFIFLIGGVAVVLANLIADLIIVRLDPRVSIT